MEAISETETSIAVCKEKVSGSYDDVHRIWLEGHCFYMESFKFVVVTLVSSRYHCKMEFEEYKPVQIK